jgi:hypothetical protein
MALENELYYMWTGVEWMASLKGYISSLCDVSNLLLLIVGPEYLRRAFVSKVVVAPLGAFTIVTRLVKVPLSSRRD